MEHVKESRLRKSLRLVKGDKKLKPIPSEELSPELNGVLAMFKPVLTNMLGNLGEHANIYVFNNKDEKGSVLINPLEEGKFKFEYLGKNIEYKTPLAALIQNKTCPKDQEEMNGTWKFCPYHGVELKYVD